MALVIHDIEQAVKSLSSGELVALPTETVYGLGASVSSEVALKRVFTLKKRPFFDPLIVHIADYKHITSLVSEWPQWADKLARKFWPGPLTLIVPRSTTLNRLITSDQEFVGLRWPRHLIAQELIKKSGPLAAPSANRFGKTSPTSARHVVEEFSNEPLLVLDGGECEIGLESTVVRFNDDKRCLEILRSGGVSKESLESFSLESNLNWKVVYAQSPVAPGQLKFHYQPEVPVVLIQSNHSHLTERHKECLKELGFDLNSFQHWKSENDPALEARMMYDRLRKASKIGRPLLIFLNDGQSGELWQAIRDRLFKSAQVVFSGDEVVK